jgi:5-amino-6-(5-phosphoribosylamino)uracil reductase
MNLPYVILKSAMSIDGYIDDANPERLLLSNEEDFDRVDEVRSHCDAILVGAGTIRLDDPSLLIKSETRQSARTGRGSTQHPIKVTITKSGSIPRSCQFLTAGSSEKLVYTNGDGAQALGKELKGIPHVQVISIVDLAPQSLLLDLYERGVRKVLVEGGHTIATSFLASNCVDELQVSIAPFFVGTKTAPRFVGSANFPYNPDRPMHLTSMEQFGDVVLLTYKLRA